MTRAWTRTLVVALGAVTLLLVGPLLLRHISFFQVRQVTVLGAPYVGADAVVEAMGLAPDRNLYDDNGELVERLRALPGVVDARVERRLPATLRVTIREQIPVAYAVAEHGLVPLDGEGSPLPFDPLTSDLDLPIVRRPDSLIIRALALVRSADSALFAETQAARRLPDATLVFELPRSAVLFRGVPSLEQLTAVSVVRQHLATEAVTPREVDARFRGWIVVRGARS